MNQTILKEHKFDFDVIIVGSGFGGSVSAYRLSQKGYKVLVIESGKRWKAGDFPKTNWSLRKYLWMPKLGFYGIQRINLLNDFLLVSGSGVGGGSLVYACTLYVPSSKVLNSPLYSKMGGEKALLPYYEVAKHMLGVTENPQLWEPDHLLLETAKTFGKEDTFRRTPVGIYFGNKKDPKDPFFDGEGPDRDPCNYCGGCMVGCRHNAKNTLDKNYLYLAEKLGAVILPETKVTSLIPLNVKGIPDPEASGEFGYELETNSTTGWFGYPKRKFRSNQVVLSAGVMGTVGLLLKMQQENKMIRLSEKLGDTVRTNSETVLPVTVPGSHNADYSRGIAITSSVHPDENTHIEPVRYSKGSDFFGVMASVMTDGGGKFPRPLKFFWTMVRHPLYFLKAHNPFGFAKNSIILLVMQTVDNSVRLVRKRRFVWPFQKTLTSTLSTGEPTPTYIPIANAFTRKLAEIVGGIPRSSLNETLLSAPVTGHIMGGCIVAESPEKGVIDLENKVFGYENLRVCDASMLTVNLGVNPSLTITALSERAMSLIPPKETKEIQFLKFEVKRGFDKTIGFKQTKRVVKKSTTKQRQLL
ncbi:GMC family oxidoreductase [Leptospira yanagawae]|uniref:Cholesterol oxidase n=1 Tax=Leptospira yanagawae TaxID=293069 RepID=A0ABY2M553_9LEPT|nr:GMC family oxidoreductase [Leptospira yanagawae]TGL24340.1 GMC family oxidoreductase [Leptospira yanagawae]